MAPLQSQCYLSVRLSLLITQAVHLSCSTVLCVTEMMCGGAPNTVQHPDFLCDMIIFRRRVICVVVTVMSHSVVTYSLHYWSYGRRHSKLH